MFKRLALMTMAATILAATPAYAGQWMQDGNGWWWQNDDGSYPTAKWQWIDGNADGISERYYFNENGYILANTLTPDGNQVNADGAWIINGSVQHQNESASLPISSIQSNAGDLYYTGLRQALDSIPLYPMETTGSEELDRVLNIIFSQIITEDMDTHDKLKACYDYIIQNTEYVAPACGGEPYYSAYGVFMVGEGICDTYSAADAVMARKIGVPLYLAGGETHSAGGGFTPHAWCQLDYNGVTYIFDPQVEDDITNSVGYTMYIRFGGTSVQLADKYILESTVEITEKTKVKNEEYVKTKEFWKEYGVPLRF